MSRILKGITNLMSIFQANWGMITSDVLNILVPKREKESLVFCVVTTYSLLQQAVLS